MPEIILTGKHYFRDFTVDSFLVFTAYQKRSNAKGKANMIIQAKDPLAGIENDDLNATVSAPARTTTSRAPADYVPATVRAFTEPCKKCGGTGMWRTGYPCFACKGHGKQTFSQSPEKRAADRASAGKRKASKIEAFKIEHPDVWAWMDGSNFPPAVEMRAKLEKYGSLLDHSITFAKHMIVKRDQARAAAEAAKIERIEQAPAVNATALHAAFAKAAKTGKRAPKLIVQGIKIYPAKPGSANEGALYVRSNAGYLGKIKAGKFMRSRECSDADQAVVVEVIADPKAAAIKSGIMTTRCAVCGITLTDPASIDAGIGPVCATKFGW